MSKQTYKILIVDDSAEDRVTFRCFLEKDKEVAYVFLEAELGGEGITACLESKPDCVLLNYTLPDGNGLAVLKAINPDPLDPVFPVILLTGAGDESLAVKVMKQGAQDYLVKGEFSYRELQRAVVKGIELFSLRRRQKQSEAELRHKQEELADFFENASVGLHWVDANGIIIWANRAELELLGYTAEEYIGHSINKFHADADIINDILNRLTSDETLFNYEARLRCKDGSLRYVLINSNVLREDGKFIHTRCFTRDITERKRQELELRESEERLRLANEATGIGIWEWNVLTNQIRWDAEMFRIYGIEPTKDGIVFYEDWSGSILPEDLPRNEEILQETVRQAGNSRRAFRIHRRNNREIRHIEAVETVRSNAEGQTEWVVGTNLDVTERKLAAEDLRESERRFRAIFDNAAVGIAHVALDGTWITVNQQLCEIVGYTAEELYKIDFQKITHPNDLSSDLNFLHRLLAGDIDTYSLNKRYIHKDNSIVWINLTVSLVRNDADAPDYFISVVKDISESKQAEAELRESQEVLSLAMQSSRMGAWSRDLATETVYWSAKLEELFGLEAGTFAGNINGFRDYVYAADKERIEREIQTALDEHHDYIIEFRFHHTDGTMRWMEGRGQALYAPDGTPVKMYGIGIDITERKEAEEKLRESEERFRALFNSIDEGFCIIEMIFDEHNKPVDYRFEQINPAFSRLTGLPESAVGKTILEFVPDLEKFWFEIYGKVVLTGEAIRFENKSEPMNRWFEVFASRIGNGNTRRVAIVFNNITDRKTTELEREKLLIREQELRREAEDTNRAKDDFLAMLSHELRSPLNSMLGWTQILQTNKLSEEKTAQAIETIARNIRLQNALIEDVLDVSRIVSGKMRLESETVSLLLIVQSALETARPAAEKQGLKIESDFDDGDYEVFGDRHRLQQIINNLLNNAVKFTPGGGLIKIQMRRKAEHIKLIVEDTGIGIEPDLLPQIFDRFMQADASSTRRFGGLGLGLAIVKHLVELHGGTISAHSDGAEKGATFTLRLPLAATILPQDDFAPAASAKVNISTRPKSLLNLCILLVDDDPDALNLMRFVLESNGAKTVCTESAAEALLKLEENRFDLLISDLGMAEMDGYELIRQVRKSEKNDVKILPAIALTGYVSAEDRSRVLAAGFHEHLSKPVNIENLPNVILNLLKNENTLPA